MVLMSRLRMARKRRSTDLMSRRHVAQPRQPIERQELEFPASRYRQHSEIPLESEESLLCQVMARQWNHRLRLESAQPLPPPIGVQLLLWGEPPP